MSMSDQESRVGKNLAPCLSHAARSGTPRGGGYKRRPKSRKPIPAQSISFLIGGGQRDLKKELKKNEFGGKALLMGGGGGGGVEGGPHV